ncbi:MAG: hypothetical protein KAJ76_06075 [Candidatus Heimdallarchaeota archaeon]|nr:hypothetical protein [Candidatus Heimdallarchaeota archaeon]
MPMAKIKNSKKIRKFIKEIITEAVSSSVSDLFEVLKEFHELAEDIPKKEQENYERYFDKYMTHEINLVRIELRKIEFNYKESMHRTNKRAEKFDRELANESLAQEMRVFYQKEYLNILKPMFYIEQVYENFQKYLEVIKVIQEEFNEWFFLGNLDFMKKLLQPYIVVDDSSRREKEIWIYKRYQKELTDERKKKMFDRAGLLVKDDV